MKPDRTEPALFLKVSVGPTPLTIGRGHVVLLTESDGQISWPSRKGLLQRLPELYAGIAKTDIDLPVQYRGGNVPQAWAAGSVFFLLEAILGIDPDAENAMLDVDPTLPDWLPELRLRDLKIADQVLDIEFRRDAGETKVNVLKGNPATVVRRSYRVPAAERGELAASLAQH